MTSAPEQFGPYVDLKPLKGGGFGQVYTGRHSVLGRTDAIKMLAPGLIQSDEDNERFYREASAMAQLDHPHVVRVHTAGVEMGFPYIAMAYVEGDDLGDYIRARGPLEVADVVRLGREIGSALAHMHAQGIIHRDLKSSNVLRRASDGRFFLADFGIALQENLPRISSTTLGSQEYISPEQIDGHTDARSDVYSLGVVLFEALTGQVPFAQGPGHRDVALGQLLNRIYSETAPLASTLRAGVPSWLDETIAACLAKAPEARPQSAASVVAALRSKTATTRISGPVAPPPAAPPQAAPPHAAPPVPPAPAYGVRQPTRRISGPLPVRPHPQVQRPVQQPVAPAGASGPVYPYPQQAPPQQAYPQAYPQQESNTLLWVIALLAALVIIAAGLYIANTVLLPPRQQPVTQPVVPTSSDRTSGERASGERVSGALADAMDAAADAVSDAADAIEDAEDVEDVIGDDEIIAEMEAEPVSVDAQQVAQSYLASQGRNSVAGLLGLYADRVDYYGNGGASRSDIAEDKNYYFDRWPDREYRLAGPVQTTTRADGTTRIRFDYTFSVRGEAGVRDGVAWTELDLVPTPSGDVLIAAERGGTR